MLLFISAKARVKKWWGINNLLTETKMIISFNGDHGSGKSTLAQMAAEKLNYPRYYMGQIFRDMAKERGLTLEEFHHLRDADPKFDNDLEKFVVDLSKKYADFVIESRTAWHFIPSSLKIYLKVKDTEGAKRIFKEIQRENNRNEANNLDSEKKVLEKINKRREKDDITYKNYYDIDIRNENNYDFILDTTDLSIDQAFEKVMEFIQSKIND
jgi:CMP/dCMP kinase